MVTTRDLAKLYHCANGTKTINQAVKRNIKKFPNDFYFQLSYDEYENLKSQFGTSSSTRYGGVRKLPYAFTELGVSMLATVIHTEIAIGVTINIMRAFVEMKRYISNNLINQSYYNDMVIRHDSEIKLLQETLSNFKEKNNHIFFDGQIYDSYSIMLDILNTSKKSIIIIDNYIDKNILDILSKTNKRITLITNKYNNEDYNKYKEQYSNINLVINNKIHDKFIIIDKKILYHCGASFKDLGKKCFAITKINEDNVLTNLLENL